MGNKQYMDISSQNSQSDLSLSVIVPAYNCAQTLHKCIDSLLSSIGDKSEILIINDGSTDETINVAKDLANVDCRIHTISQPNQGVSAARNRGIEEARGEYVAFVDADDWIDEPYTLFKSLLHAAEASQAEVVIGGYTTQSPHQNLSLEGKVYNRDITGEFEALIMLRSIGKPYGKLIRRNFLLQHSIKFPIGMRHQEDAVFLYKMLCKAKIVATICDSTYHYVLPEVGKVYAFSVQDELTGYTEMSQAIDSLQNSIPNIGKTAYERLEQRKINMALHVFNALQHESNKLIRRNTYPQIEWNTVLPSLEIHPIKKWLLKVKQYTILDLISSFPKISF